MVKEREEREPRPKREEREPRPKRGRAPRARPYPLPLREKAAAKFEALESALAPGGGCLDGQDAAACLSYVWQGLRFADRSLQSGRRSWEEATCFFDARNSAAVLLRRASSLPEFPEDVLAFIDGFGAGRREPSWNRRDMGRVWTSFLAYAHANFEPTVEQ